MEERRAKQMRKTAIKRQAVIQIPYTLPIQSIIRFLVSSDSPVNVHVVDGDGLHALKNGAKFDTWGSFYAHVNHDFYTVAQRAKLHLVIESNDSDANVEYDVLVIR